MNTIQALQAVVNITAQERLISWLMRHHNQADCTDCNWPQNKELFEHYLNLYTRLAIFIKRGYTIVLKYEKTGYRVISKQPLTIMNYYDNAKVIDEHNVQYNIIDLRNQLLAVAPCAFCVRKFNVPTKKFIKSLIEETS